MTRWGVSLDGSASTGPAVNTAVHRAGAFALGEVKPALVTATDTATVALLPPATVKLCVPKPLTVPAGQSPSPAVSVIACAAPPASAFTSFTFTVFVTAAAVLPMLTFTGATLASTASGGAVCGTSLASKTLSSTGTT